MIKIYQALPLLTHKLKQLHKGESLVTRLGIARVKKLKGTKMEVKPAPIYILLYVFCFRSQNVIGMQSSVCYVIALSAKSDCNLYSDNIFIDQSNFKEQQKFQKLVHDFTFISELKLNGNVPFLYTEI